MKNEYVSPKLELIRLEQDEVLAPSGTSPVIEPSKNQSGSTAEKFGDVTLW